MVKNIWSSHFGTTALLLVLLSWRIVGELDLETSDKDIILVFALLAIGLYFTVLGYSFCKTLFKGQARNRKSFYILSLPMVITNLIFLFRVIADNNLGITVWWTLIPLLCGLNILTYFWGLLANESAA